MREYVKLPLLHAHARMSLLVYLANAMPMDTKDRTMPMPARHQSRLASAMMSSPFYSFINEYITISIALPSLIALLRRIPSIMKPFFSKNIIKYNNYYINIFRIFRRGISIEYENTTEATSVKVVVCFSPHLTHCPAERKRSTSKLGFRDSVRKMLSTELIFSRRRTDEPPLKRGYRIPISVALRSISETFFTSILR